tara:strand:- start:33 stop:803 length:771 start_codon:yes stop_codon:yes gene_type:complete
MRTRYQTRRYNAATKIQQRMREHIYLKSQIDPITMDHMHKPVYRCVDIETNKITYLQLDSFIQFLEHVGDFRNPINRKCLNPLQIKTLQCQANRELPTLTRVYDNMCELEQKRKEELEFRSVIGYLSTNVYSVLEVGIEICATIEFSSYETCIMLISWCCSLKITILKMLTYLQSNLHFTGNVEFIYNNCLSKLNDAVSGPYFHDEMCIQYIHKTVDHLLKPIQDIECWVSEVREFMPGWPREEETNAPSVIVINI